MPEFRGARRPPHFDLGRAPYFVTARTLHSRPLFREELGEIAVHQLLSDRDRYGFLLLAYAFMPDHAHFVIVPANGRTISSTMRVVKGGIARRLNMARGGKGSIWQEGFYEKVARTMAQLNAYITYTHRNPVAAGLVSRDEEYALSSAAAGCVEDYQRFVNEPVVASPSHARAEKPAPQNQSEESVRSGLGGNDS